MTIFLKYNHFIHRYILINRLFSTASSSTTIFDRAIEPVPSDQTRKRYEQFESPENARISKTVIIGCPNAGKSRLTNALVDAPVSAVSNKVHTTRKTTRGAILLNDRTQLLVLDTPGVVTSKRAKKHNLEETLLTDPDGAMLGADTACVLLNASDRYTRDRLDPRILHLLYRHRYRITSALILSKIDLVKDRTMLLKLATKLTKGVVGGKTVPAKEADTILSRGGASMQRNSSTDDCDKRNEKSTDTRLEEIEDENFKSNNETTTEDELLRKYWTDVNWNTLNSITDLPWPQVQESMLNKCYRNEIGWPLFDRLFMVSAVNGQGVDELRQYLNERSKIGQWRFPPSIVTDQNAEDLVKDIVRAKLMDRLLYHIPYTLKFKVCVWEVNENDVLCIRMDVICPQERDVKFIIGPKGKTVAETAQDVTKDLRNLFQREVFFRLGVYASTSKNKK